MAETVQKERKQGFIDFSVEEVEGARTRIIQRGALYVLEGERLSDVEVSSMSVYPVCRTKGDGKCIIDKNLDERQDLVLKMRVGLVDGVGGATVVGDVSVNFEGVEGKKGYVQNLVES